MQLWLATKRWFHSLLRRLVCCYTYIHCAPGETWKLVLSVPVFWQGYHLWLWGDCLDTVFWNVADGLRKLALIFMSMDTVQLKKNYAKKCIFWWNLEVINLVLKCHRYKWPFILFVIYDVWIQNWLKINNNSWSIKRNKPFLPS